MDRVVAPWLRHEALLPLPPDAGPWGVARMGGGEVAFESVPDAATLARQVREDLADSVHFGWTPHDRHLRPVYELDEIAEDVEARGRRAARRELRQSLPAFLATIALIVAAIVFWPASLEMQIVAILLVIFVVLPLWRRGVERAWDGWRGLQLLEHSPAVWRAGQARRLRFSVWSVQGRSMVAQVLAGMFVITYLAMRLSGMGPSVERFGLIKEDVLAGEWWRLLTCAFLHNGLVHLIFNSMAGLALAAIARTLVDESRILFVFVASVVAGSIASLALSPHASIGASGGILGWGGLLAGMALVHPDLRQSGLLSNILRWVLLLAVIGIAGAKFIDNAAHAGGFLAGAVCGLGLVQRPPRPLPLWSTPPRALWVAAIAVGGGAWLVLLWDLFNL